MLLLDYLVPFGIRTKAKIKKRNMSTGDWLAKRNA